MTLIHDPNAEARSLMNRAPCICDGEKTGIQCKNFWAVVQKFAAQNADTLRSGEKQRACTLMSGWPLEFVSEEKPTFCNRYEPRKETGLVAIVKRTAMQLAGRAPGPGYVLFPREFERFNPMTQEEIEKNRAENPDKPVQRFHGFEGPLPAFSAEEIAKGPQIGIIPKDDSPESEAARAAVLAAAEGKLTAETEKGLDGIFGTGDSGGIFNKKD